MCNVDSPCWYLLVMSARSAKAESSEPSSELFAVLNTSSSPVSTSMAPSSITSISTWKIFTTDRYLIDLKRKTWRTGTQWLTQALSNHLCYCWFNSDFCSEVVDLYWPVPLLLKAVFLWSHSMSQQFSSSFLCSLMWVNWDYLSLKRENTGDETSF